MTEAPQSMRKLAAPRSTKKQVLNRPPEPNASPEPRNFNRMSILLSLSAQKNAREGGPLVTPQVVRWKLTVKLSPDVRIW